MKKMLLPGTALVAVVLAIAGGALALGAFDDDDDGGSRDAVADQAKCAAEATDCVEPGGDDAGNGDVSAGMCISEDDPQYDPNVTCDDMVVEGDGNALGMCAPGFTDCVDMVVEDSGDVAQSCLVGATDCNDTPETGAQDECSVENAAACEANMRDLAFADLEQRIPGQEITVVSVEYTEWPDSSLGNPQPDMAYAQVITPGFKMLLEVSGQQYEYHTDLFGQFTAVN